MSTLEQSPDYLTDPPLRLLAAFQSAYSNATPEIILQAPERELWIAATVDETGIFRLHAPDLGRRTAFSYRSARRRQTLLRRPLPGWARFAAGVALDLYAAGLVIPGLQMVIVGEEPHGPRYHHAMGMAVAALWYDFFQHPYSAGRIVNVLERVRRDYLESPAG